MPVCRHLPKALAILSLLVATGAGAQPGPLGPEYPADERELPGPEWWLSCQAASGESFTVLRGCGEDACPNPGGVFLDHRNQSGASIGIPIRVNEEPAVLTSAIQVTCHPTGWVVVQWRDAATGCYVHRVFDEDGRASGDPQPFLEATADCRLRPDVGVHADGSFMTAWAAGFWAEDSAVLARRFHRDGSPHGPPVVVSRASDGSSRRAKIAVDETGVALVVWTRAVDGTPDEILARFVGADGQPVGTEFQVNTFGFGEVSEPVVASEGDGVFEILWSNWLQGGRVGRRVSIDAAGGPTTTTTTLPPPATMPRFGAPRVLDSTRAEERVAAFHQITVGAGAAWILQDPGASYRRSDDDGADWSHWQSAARLEGYSTLALGSDEQGGWLALHASDTGGAIHLSRSTDEARTWTAPAPTPRELHTSACSDCWLAGGAVRGSPEGTWIAALPVAGGESDPLMILRSTNGGRQWQTVEVIDAGHGPTAVGFDLETDGTGTWILTWIDESLWVSVSNDDGAHWSKPRMLAGEVVCTDCRQDARYARVELANDGSGRWLAVFASRRHAADRFGHDADVFVVRSDDRGRTWTGPAPIHADAAVDGSRDADPSVATDGSGRWLVAWTSHRPVAPGDDLDADVLLAMSTDAGATWSGPVPIDADPGSRLDWAPHLAANGHGVWMLTWNSSDLDADERFPVNRILLAAADARCGDGRLGAAEQCDDGGLGDGDGCDSNCTATGCGNGIVTEGEACDDANERTLDLCMPDCRAGECGDGVVEGIEECDDANDVNTDDCPAGCRWAHCGDGHVYAGVENCDDGNAVNEDACTDHCWRATCGDGYVQDGVEACDDGGAQGHGACPVGCREPNCGDGFTSFPFEDCDYLDPIYEGVCSHDCRLPDVCGDANGDGLVTVTDSRRILRRGVGLYVACPMATCDMDSSHAVTAGDAQMALGKAVGLAVAERCSLGTGPIVFWTDDRRSFGALQFEVDYSASGGEFPGTGNTIDCDMPFGELPDFDHPPDVDPTAPIAFGAVNDEDSTKRLVVALISAEGLQGPIDLMRCRFELPEGASGGRFKIRVNDATAPDFESLLPPPSIGYRLE